MRNNKLKIGFEQTETLDNENLQALTVASSEPALQSAEKEKTLGAKKLYTRLKATTGLTATVLLAGSLLLTACSSDDDCLPSTPPAAAAAATSGSDTPFGTPAAGSPTTPGSSQFTNGQNGSNQTYCRSRRTGGYYWYGGTYFVGGSSS